LNKFQSFYIKIEKIFALFYFLTLIVFVLNVKNFLPSFYDFGSSFLFWPFTQYLTVWSGMIVYFFLILLIPLVGLRVSKKNVGTHLTIFVLVFLHFLAFMYLLNGLASL